MNNDYLRLFQTESDYDSAKPDFIYPTVSYVRDVDEVRYMENPLATPFYIEALADGMTVTLNKNDLEYSTDQQVWSALPMNTASPAINTGERIYLRGNAEATSYSGIGRFTISQQCNVGGNIMSLLFNDDFKDKTGLTGYDYAFNSLFDGQPVVNASDLILPATTLADWCYNGMFSYCESLTTAPELPALVLADGCYCSMFADCSSLTTAPVLPATTLAESCYEYMFPGCSSLTTAPELPATTLGNKCYRQMFQNCTSLTATPALPATTLADECYNYMFGGCTSLTTAPRILPATTLSDNCYGGMFQGCTQLEVAPALPATTLTNSCYNSMFYECASLVAVPELPALVLKDDCYGGMFQGCTSLTTAPELPATTLTDKCYYSMFRGCSNLNYIKMLATDISTSDCLWTWVYNVSATGTFVKNPALSEETIGRGDSGIPAGWTVVDAE